MIQIDDPVRFIEATPSMHPQARELVGEIGKVRVIDTSGVHPQAWVEFDNRGGWWIRHDRLERLR